MRITNKASIPALLLILAALSAPGSLFAMGAREQPDSITLYSGRGESLVEPLVRQFETETGITVNVRYAGTSELAVLLQEEGSRSPADIFWAQDAGALGAVARRGLLRELPADIAEGVPSIYRNRTGEWVATSGRARVLAYHPARAEGIPFPESVFDLLRPEYRGMVGWAPTNGSFQSFITAMRVEHGEEETLRWVEGMIANDAQSYRNNTAIVEALGAQEIALGITNNYYLLRFLHNDEAFPVRQRFFRDGDTGNLVNVAGAGILESARNASGAEQFLRWLLSEEAQQFFTAHVYEYPVIGSVEQNPQLESFEGLLEASPQLDLDELEDLEGTLNLLRRAGAL
ncbi:MAG: iron ABC transporter substrate-binding protein [Spirochaetaceae bacterium]|nr:MAG: iron ABC transporter substrate-binding protein [Spirochaetaceae bacterium]